MMKNTNECIKDHIFEYCVHNCDDQFAAAMISLTFENSPNPPSVQMINKPRKIDKIFLKNTRESFLFLRSNNLSCRSI